MTDRDATIEIARWRAADNGWLFAEPVAVVCRRGWSGRPGRFEIEANAGKLGSKARFVISAVTGEVMSEGYGLHRSLDTLAVDSPASAVTTYLSGPPARNASNGQQVMSVRRVGPAGSSGDRSLLSVTRALFDAIGDLPAVGAFDAQFVADLHLLEKAQVRVAMAADGGVAGHAGLGRAMHMAGAEGERAAVGAGEDEDIDAVRGQRQARHGPGVGPGPWFDRRFAGQCFGPGVLHQHLCELRFRLYVEALTGVPAAEGEQGKGGEPPQASAVPRPGRR